MARTSQSSRGHAFLGHGPRDPFAGVSASPPSSYGNSDVDFSDVFGGPPRCSSMGHAGPAESAGGWEEVAAPRRPWSCSFGENPVFGGVGIGSPGRRRLLGDEFFDDIFRINESKCSTPRKSERNVFLSNPGSKVPSPAWPLPSASDLHGRGPTLPASHSIVTKPGKGSDYLAFRPPTPDFVDRNEKSVPEVFDFPSPAARTTTKGRRSVHIKVNPKSDVLASFKESPVSHGGPYIQHRPSEATKVAGDETKGSETRLERGSSDQQVHNDSGYFHFSMYKWAGIGVSLIMAPNLKERTKEVPARSSGTTHCPTDNQATVQGIKAFHDQYDLEARRLNDLGSAQHLNKRLAEETIEVLPLSSNTRSAQNINDKSETKEGSSMSVLQQMNACSTDSANASTKILTPDIKNILQPHDHYKDEEGHGKILRQSRNEEHIMTYRSMKTKDVNHTANIEQPTIGKILSPSTTQTRKEVNHMLSVKGDKTTDSRVKGKVKEFIKLFSQETSPRLNSSVIAENQAQRPTNRSKVRGGVETYASPSLVNLDKNKEKVDNEAFSTSIPKVVIQEKLDSFFSMQNVDDSSEAKVIPPQSSTDSIQDILNVSFCSLDETFIEIIDECPVEESYENQNGIAKNDPYQEEIKKLDAQVREWSKGKEGNIRSLLSTLQHVLWPGSGWKPVPLVDIIEGASVRRAYQKALLCLHPDKLQQKGAEMHQKYIAEKIFDILQERNMSVCVSFREMGGLDPFQFFEFTLTATSLPLTPPPLDPTKAKK